ESHDMDRARIDDALHTMPARRLEQVVGADDVRLEDPLEGILDPDRTHMHYRPHALDHAIHGARIGEISEHDLLARQGWPELANTRAPHPAGPTSQMRPEPPPKRPRRPRKQHRPHLIQPFMF